MLFDDEIALLTSAANYNVLKFELPIIYPITDCCLSGLSHIEQASRLIAGGAKVVQLRDKTASPRDFYESASAVMRFARGRGVKIIINDRVDMALTIKANGVHLGQDDLPPEMAREILGPEAIIGVSTHSVEQARRAILLPVDYITIGPIFHTKTKSNPDEVVGFDGLSAVRDATGNFPLVAIGGITAANLISVLVAGADSAAIVADILSDPDKIESRMRHLSGLILV